MQEKKISTTLYLTRTRSERLKVLHTHTRVSAAEYIYQEIGPLLKQYEAKLPEQLTSAD